MNQSTLSFLFKLANILPPPTLAARAMGALGKIPKPGKVPVIGAVNPDTSNLFHLASQTLGTIKPPAAKIVKAASASFFGELELLAPELLDKLAEADVEELLKEAISMTGMRGAIANVAGKVSPVLNKPVMQAAQQGAHALQKSPNSFAQGVGNVLHHKVQTPGKAFLAAANPVGTAAEALTAGAGNAASKGIAAGGGRMAQRFAAPDAVSAAGRAMTPKGRLQNALGGAGQRIQGAFSPGGTGHNVMTKHIPLAAELGGAVGAGMALHGPVGLAGVAGKLGLGAMGKAAPAIGHALEHAPHAAEAIANKVTPIAKGIGGALHHAAEDVLGTQGQSLMGRLGARVAGGAAQAGSMVPAAAAGMAHAMPHIPGAPGLPKFGSAASAVTNAATNVVRKPLLQRAMSAVGSPGGTHAAELAGLGILAVPGLDSLQAHGRAAVAGQYNKDGVKSREVLPHIAHPLLETAGLGVLAGPSIAHLMGHAH